MNTKNDPTADLNKVSIEVDGVRYEGWKSARIDMSIDQICRAFVLSVTDNFPGNHNFSRLQPPLLLVTTREASQFRFRGNLRQLI